MRRSIHSSSSMVSLPITGTGRTSIKTCSSSRIWLWWPTRLSPRSRRCTPRRTLIPKTSRIPPLILTLPLGLPLSLFFCILSCFITCQIGIRSIDTCKLIIGSFTFLLRRIDMTNGIGMEFQCHLFISFFDKFLIPSVGWESQRCKWIICNFKNWRR